MMRATEFEFRQRSLCIGLIFSAGFLCYSLDHRTAGVALALLVFGKNLNLDSPDGIRAVKLVFAFAAFLCIFAAAIRTWGAAYLDTQVVQDRALHSERLVADGPYRYTRNPLYFASVFLGAGMGILASRVGWFVITVGLFLFYYRLIGREEAALGALQGERYRAYCAAVPRFWPTLRARVPSGGMQPRWGQAWIGELWMWSFAAATVAFAATLKIVLFWIFMVTGLVVAVLAHRIRKRRKK